MNNTHRFCICLTNEKTAGSKAAVLDQYKWGTGAVISAKFVGGDRSLHDRIEKVANEWTKYARITFDFRKPGDTDLRIGFVAGDGSWSFLGTYNRQVPQNRLTMNYGWLTKESSDQEVRSVVLHEFGHALGLIHEHQNPVGGIKWKREAVIKDLSGPPNNWGLPTIEANMFKSYSMSEVTATPVDRTSIMMYVIPSRWTEDGFSADLNSTLSAEDRRLIAQAYP